MQNTWTIREQMPANKIIRKLAYFVYISRKNFYFFAENALHLCCLWYNIFVRKIKGGIKDEQLINEGTHEQRLENCS